MDILLRFIKILCLPFIMVIIFLLLIDIPYVIVYYIITGEDILEVFLHQKLLNLYLGE